MTSKITSNTVEKIKDPKRVEQGKKLAAISKGAKEKKAREKFETEKLEYRRQEDGSWNINYGYVIGTAGVITAIGALYFAYRQDKALEKTTVPCDQKPQVDRSNTLEMFD